MNIKRWIARREPNWKQLDALLSQVEKNGLKSLQTGEIKQLASLYRSVSADLARARTHQVGETVIRDLQVLTTRSYSQVYQGSRRQEWAAVKDFYRWGLPAVIRQSWAYIAIATTIFLSACFIAWWFSWRDPNFMPLIVPESLISQVRDDRQLWMGSILGNEPTASSQIMVNNLAVCFRAIAGGMTLGLFTIYVLFLNGLLIGAIATLVSQGNLAYPFWAFVFPHGSLELPAIFISGAAGLLIARGILFPGKLRRKDAIRVYGLQAVQLVYGIVPLLVIAGVIEGFISPQPAIPEAIRYFIGTALFLALIIYCNLRRPDRATTIDSQLAN